MDCKCFFGSGESPGHVEDKSVNNTFDPDLGLRLGDAASSVVKHTLHPGFGLQHGKKTSLEKKT